VIVLAAVAAAFAFSFVMLRQALGAGSPWLGLLPMFCLLGLAKLAEPLFLLRVPEPIRAVRQSARKSAGHGLPGIAAFGGLLRHPPLRYLNSVVYLARGRPALARTCRLVEAAEAAHLYAVVVLLPWIAHVWSLGQLGPALVLVLVEAFFNIYPILHLRTVRGRLEHSLQRSHPRHASVEATHPD